MPALITSSSIAAVTGENSTRMTANHVDSVKSKSKKSKKSSKDRSDDSSKNDKSKKSKKDKKKDKKRKNRDHSDDDSDGSSANASDESAEKDSKNKPSQNKKARVVPEHNADNKSTQVSIVQATTNVAAPSGEFSVAEFLATNKVGRYCFCRLLNYFYSSNNILPLLLLLRAQCFTQIIFETYTRSRNCSVL